MERNRGRERREGEVQLEDCFHCGVIICIAVLTDMLEEKEDEWKRE